MIPGKRLPATLRRSTGRYAGLKAGVTRQPWLNRTAAHSAARKTCPLCNEVTGAPKYGAPVSGNELLVITNAAN